MDALSVKLHIGEVGWVMTKTKELGNAVFTPHIPIDVGLVRQYHLGNGSCPTASTHDRYPS